MTSRLFAHHQGQSLEPDQLKAQVSLCARSTNILFLFAIKSRIDITGDKEASVVYYLCFNYLDTMR